MDPINFKRALKRAASSLSLRNGSHSVILTYHSIGAGGRFSQPIETFDEQMRILSERFTVVALPRLLEAVQAGVERLAAVTFDDGFADLYFCAFPILRMHRLPFTVFLATSFLESDCDAFAWSPHYAGLDPLTWEQVREMMTAGCHVGSHTHSHARLSECATVEIRAELTRSRSILETQTGSCVTLLAYPFGQPHDYDRRAMAAAAESGYTAAFTTLQSGLTSIPKPYEIPRVMIDASDSRDDFLQKITGKRNYVARLERLNSVLVRAGLRGALLAAPPSKAGSCL
jgi:peptidoglycan/xylan/chitin deacetylase (PgdA/CDA1 family)